MPLSGLKESRIVTASSIVSAFITYFFFGQNLVYTIVACVIFSSLVANIFKINFGGGIIENYKKIEIKSKYPLVRLGDHVEPLGGLWTGKNPPFKLVKVIRNTNFTMQGELNLDNVAEIQVEENAFVKRKLQKGDIIIEKSGGSQTQAVGRPQGIPPIVADSTPPKIQ